MMRQSHSSGCVSARSCIGLVGLVSAVSLAGLRREAVGINPAAYDRVRFGMTPGEVTRALGSPPGDHRSPPAPRGIGIGTSWNDRSETDPSRRSNPSPGCVLREWIADECE